MQNKISIKDIAKISRTSITTVSFVINGKAKEKNISEEVTKRIQKTVAELGYKPNALARGLRTGKSKIIGFLVDDISKPFFSKIATSIDHMASMHGYKIIFSSIGNDQGSANETLRIFKERQVDGYIIAITAGIEEEIQALIGHDTPVVFFDRYLPELKGDYVLTDNFNATANATRHLLENGFKHIAFVTTNSEELQLLDRLRGYSDVVDHAAQQKYILKIDYTNSKNSTETISRFLSDHKDLDAVIFATNYLTMDGLQLLKTDEKDLLSTKGIISFDDFELLEFLNPSITAVEQPVQAIAENIINILINQLKNTNSVKAQPGIVELKAKLNVRHSTTFKKS